MDKTTEQVTIGSTNDEKRKYLFLKQIATLKASETEMPLVKSSTI